MNNINKDIIKALLSTKVNNPSEKNLNEFLDKEHIKRLKEVVNDDTLDEEEKKMLVLMHEYGHLMLKHRSEIRNLIMNLFTIDQMGEGAQAKYPVADDYEEPVFILPKTKGQSLNRPNSEVVIQPEEVKHYLKKRLYGTI